MYQKQNKILLEIGVVFLQSPVFQTIRVFNGIAEMKVYDTVCKPIKDEHDALVFLATRKADENLVFVLPNMDGGLVHTMYSGQSVIRYYETPMNEEEKSSIGNEVENENEVENNYKYLLIR